QPQRPLERAGRAEEPGPIEGEIDAKTKGSAVAHLLLDHLPQVAGADHDARGAAGAEQVELMGDERLAVDVHEGFGHGRGQRLQPRGQAPRQDRHRVEPLGHDWMTTLVPSKSNRNRTSWSPAWRIAARRRTLSSA